MSIFANDIDPAIYTVYDNTTNEDRILKLEAKEKEREHRCPSCKSRRIKLLDPIPNTKRCMYNGLPAECVTSRTYFECRGCGKKFFGDDHYFDNHVSRSFTADFIMHAIKLWLTDMDASFTEVAKSLEISYAIMEEWHVDLYRKFAEKTKINCAYALLLYSFNRPQYKRRGVVFTKESKDAAPRIVSFIENYTLDDVLTMARDLQKKEKSKVQLVYYSFVAGLGNGVSSLSIEPRCVAVNIDMLHDELIAMLPKNLDKDVNNELTNAIGIAFALEDESADKNKIVEDFNAVIDQIIRIDAENASRTELLNQYRISHEELPYFENSRFVEDIGGVVFDNPISDPIQDMTAENQSFYAIALKILYDNDAFKEKIQKTLEELAKEKRAEYEKKRLERRLKKFVKDTKGAVSLTYNKESPVAEMLDIFGFPDIEGFSVPVK